VDGEIFTLAKDDQPPPIVEILLSNEVSIIAFKS
jgi:hypothetical protein